MLHDIHRVRRFSVCFSQHRIYIYGIHFLMNAIFKATQPLLLLICFVWSVLNHFIWYWCLCQQIWVNAQVNVWGQRSKLTIHVWKTARTNGETSVNFLVMCVDKLKQSPFILDKGRHNVSQDGRLPEYHILFQRIVWVYEGYVYYSITNETMMSNFKCGVNLRKWQRLLFITVTIKRAIKYR